MIGRVMRTMTGALSGNGSSPQLHEACAKVAAALVRYTIDSESSAAEAEDILKDVSRPLVDLLTGIATLVLGLRGFGNSGIHFEVGEFLHCRQAGTCRSGGGNMHAGTGRVGEVEACASGLG